MANHRKEYASPKNASLILPYHRLVRIVSHESFCPCHLSERNASDWDRGRERSYFHSPPLQINPYFSLNDDDDDGMDDKRPQMQGTLTHCYRQFLIQSKFLKFYIKPPNN
ncbi:hypothetical protein Tco_0622662 [Tanacetum coccineum]